ncbi:MAG: hypothetical protein ACK5ML_11360 [Lachnospiraceae bacterium]
MREIYQSAVEEAVSADNNASIEGMGEGAAEMADSMITGMSLGAIVTFGAMTEAQVEGLITMFQEQL